MDEKDKTVLEKLELLWLEHRSLTIDQYQDRMVDIAQNLSDKGLAGVNFWLSVIPMLGIFTKDEWEDVASSLGRAQEATRIKKNGGDPYAYLKGELTANTSTDPSIEAFRKNLIDKNPGFPPLS